MRASTALLATSAVAAAVALSSAAAACDDPCCRSGVDCVDGAVCFEGRCALRCVDDDGCVDHARCVGGRCDPAEAGDQACAWGTTPLPPVGDEGAGP